MNASEELEMMRDVSTCTRKNLHKRASTRNLVSSSNTTEMLVRSFAQFKWRKQQNILLYYTVAVAIAVAAVDVFGR